MLWGPPAYSVGTGGAFNWGRAAGTWSWPPTSIYWHYTSTPPLPSCRALGRLYSLSFSLSASLSSFCSHSYFVLPFVFVSLVIISRVPPLYLLFLVHLFSSLIIFLRLILFLLFFLTSFLVLRSFVFMSCTFPSVFGHSPVMQHWELTHFRFIDTHFMTSHRFMSECFGSHLMLLKL